MFSLYFQVENQINDYLTTLTSQTPVAYYEQGRLVIPVATIALEGVTLLSKSARVKAILRYMDELKAQGRSKWATFTDKLDFQLLKKQLANRGFDQATLARLERDIEGTNLLRHFKDNPELADAWRVLDDANSPLKTSIDELTKVTNNIDDVRDLGYTLWKKVDGLGLGDAFTHVKTRKEAPRRKGIVGCHDKTAFFDQNIIRSVDASGNPSYVPQIGKTADEVEEIVITRKVPHSQVPGVEVVEYKIPSLSNSNPPLTTGQIKPPSNGGVKTIYDPKIWTDSNLQKAVDEAILDYAKKNGDFLEGQALIGKTSDGYDIEFFYRNGNIETFYFR
ncbi:hypothetical protein AB9P05_14970 [Roseivirga sp. BDSF3-8]|uniref:hypothetical protein n=1 Tax=Roseivirga sp. BDSF3-8 TaxID=3241598 RepID=UPI003532273A